ncbi:MAG: hypothetical protein E7415_05980 [Ruminococcaceae bacterium]|nr:hypothetical protein [Oscillospiraceae bacterium]
MAYISKFKTDTAYSNIDINEVLSAITGHGVLPFSPNEILANVSDSGVTLSDKRCEVVWADDDKTSVKICPGTVIMSDGSYIIISDEILSVPSDETAYVYICNDIVLQNIPLCSSTLPDDSESFVLLALIENGKIIDKRHLATSKIADFGAHPVVNLSGIATKNKNKIPAGDPFLSFDIGNGYTYAILTSGGKNSISICNLETGIFEKSLFSSYSNQYHTNEQSISLGYFSDIYITYINGVISLCSKNDIYSTIELSTTFYLTVF